MVELKAVRNIWNELAQRDAFWAVLTGPSGEAKVWDAEAFFRSGRDDIATALERVRAAAGEVPNGKALDFGSGLGRLTQALAGTFEHVTGVDIASAMVERARQLNQQGARCEFVVNDRDDLSLFDSDTFDFVYSRITLQHIEPRYSTKYIREFCRVLRPGGVLMFQIPAEYVPPPPPPRSRIEKRLPWSACRARIRTEAENIVTAPGTKLPIIAFVTNVSRHVWPALGDEQDRFSIRLGDHWRNRLGWMIRRDDQRAPLPTDVHPGQEVEMGIWCEAPSQPGKYKLELDMVQEMGRWFKLAGSRTKKIAVTVDASIEPGTWDGIPARMEMYGVPRDEVQQILAQQGVEVLDVQPDDAAGEQWTSFTYIGRKRA